MGAVVELPGPNPEFVRDAKECVSGCCGSLKLIEPPRRVSIVYEDFHNRGRVIAAEAWAHLSLEPDTLIVEFYPEGDGCPCAIAYRLPGTDVYRIDYRADSPSWAVDALSSDGDGTVQVKTSTTNVRVL